VQKQSGSALYVILGFIALVVGLALYSITQKLGGAAQQAPVQTDNPDTKYIQWYPQPRELVDFSLTTHKMTTMTKADLQEQWTLAFVGYTFCPDICPTTLAELGRAYADIANIPSEHPVKVWFLSVDPKRDTPERLKEYINFFNPQFIAATGEHKELYPLVRSMGMMYSMTEDTSKPNYLVDHSGSVVLINPEGNVVGRFKPQHVPGQIAISDTAQILADLPVIVGS
jgi:protein SCO1/2